MEFIVLQPETIQALRNFITIWRQDPASQTNMEILPRNIILWNPQDPDHINDITTQVFRPENLVEATDVQVDEEIDEITTIMKDLNQTIMPRTTPLINPYLGGTWKTQVDKMLHDLPIRGRDRKDQIKTLEVHFYLGALIQGSPIERTYIQDHIRKKKGDRKTKDIWRGADRIHKIFKIVPKDLLYQTQTITITQITKLTTGRFSQLIGRLEENFLVQNS